MTVELSIDGLVIGHGGHPIAGPWTASWTGGGIHLLLGSNGSGKTTLARTLLGLLPAVRGQVVNRGIDSTTWVPQINDLPDDAPLSVREVVEMGIWSRGAAGERRIGGRPGGLSRTERQSQIDKCLSHVELEGCGSLRFANLSGGQKRRVLVARALIGGARCIVMDEPVAGIDREGRAQLGGVLSKLSESSDRLFIVITHDPTWIPCAPVSVNRISNSELLEEQLP